MVDQSTPSENSMPASNVRAKEGWQTVLEEMETIADNYRERGWETLELHPGDSVFVDSERRTGLDLLLPDPEYERLESLHSEYSFSEVEVFRAIDDSMVYLLVVEQDPAGEVVTLAPGYYDVANAQSGLETVRETGQFRLFCRRLKDDYLEFVHDDPTPFLPGSD